MEPFRNPPLMQVLATLLVNLAVPEVRFGEEVEDGHENGAEDNLADDSGEDGALLLEGHDGRDDALNMTTQVCLNRRNVGFGARVCVVREGGVRILGQREGEGVAGADASRPSRRGWKPRRARAE